MILRALSRLTQWGLSQTGVYSVLSLLLLMAVMGSLLGGLNQISFKPQIGLLALMGALALIFGWLMAKSSLPGWKAGLLGAGIGLLILLVYVGELGANLRALIRITLLLNRDALEWQLEQLLQDTHLMFQLLQEMAGKLTVMFDQSWKWMMALRQGKPVYDVAIHNLVWGAAIWATGVWASWMVRRKSQTLLGVLPAGALAAVCLSHTRSDAISMMPMLMGTILLGALTSFHNHEQAWVQHKIDFAEDVRLDFAQWVLGLTVAVTSVALLLSFISPQKILRTTQDLARGLNAPDTSNEVPPGAAYQPGGGAPVSSIPGILPRQHLLGSGPELSQRMVMIVEVEDSIQPTATITPTRPIPRHYWRAMTYDFYTGRGWLTSHIETTQHRANEPVGQHESGAPGSLKQVVHSLGEPNNQAFYAGKVITLDRAFRVHQRSSPEENQDIFGVSFLHAPAPDTYKVESFQPVVSQEQLRQAGADLEPWIVERYLQLPEELPGRIVDLAQSLTDGLATPYDQALAIEDYLRSIPYSLDVSSPPEDQDVADFFLFSLQQGYCDYYATAMVVMARAVGLPSRLVLGYAGGEFDAERGGYVVTEADAHSWVEIYFPEIGWIEFEPTAARPAIQRPENAPLWEPSAPADVNESGAAPLDLRWLTWGAALAGVAGIILILWLAMDAWRLHRLTATDVLSTLYRRLYRSAQSLGVEAIPGDTPNEFLAKFHNQVKNLTRSGSLRKSIEPRLGESDLLVDHYTRAIYSTHAPGPAERELVIHSWKRLRLRLWLLRLKIPRQEDENGVSE